MKAPTRRSLRLPRTRPSPANVVVAVLLAAALALYLFPILWMYVSSARSMADFIARPLGLPSALHLDNYLLAFRTAELGRHFLISIAITASSAFLVVALGSLAAFAFSRLRFAGRRILYLSFYIGLILPIQSFLVGMFVQFRLLGLLNTLAAVILPVTALGLPIAVLLMKAYFDALPSSLEESALMEGAGALRIFLWIVLPIGNAIIATVVTFTTVNVWNEFLIPFVMIQSDRLKPLTTSLYVFSTKHSAQITLKLAALAIIATPMFIVYFAFQRQIQEGITAGAVKD